MIPTSNGAASSPQINASVIAECEDTYYRMTGFKRPRGLLANVIWWRGWLKAGFTVSDLECVIRYLQRHIKAGKRNPGALKLSNLIDRPEFFAEELGMAQDEARNHKPVPTPRETVVQQFRRAPEPQATKDARPVGDYIAELRKAAS